MRIKLGKYRMYIRWWYVPANFHWTRYPEYWVIGWRNVSVSWWKD